MLDTPKRLVVGRPLRSDRLDETLLPKRLALPVFCSDPLSSVAYATEQILLVLGLGGLALLHLTPWLALAVVAAAGRSSSPPTGRPATPIPNGGGAYAVSRANLGEDASLVAACGAADRLRADRRGLGRRRRRGDHQRRARRWRRTPSRSRSAASCCSRS